MKQGKSFEDKLHNIDILLNDQKMENIVSEMVDFVKTFRLSAIIKLNPILINNIGCFDVPTAEIIQEFSSQCFPYINKVTKFTNSAKSQRVKDKLYELFSAYFIIVGEGIVKDDIEGFDSDYMKLLFEFYSFFGLEESDNLKKKNYLENCMSAFYRLKYTGEYQRKLAEPLEKEIKSELYQLKESIPRNVTREQPNFIANENKAEGMVNLTIKELTLDRSEEFGKIDSFVYKSTMPYTEGRYLEYKNYRFTQNLGILDSQKARSFSDLPLHLDLKLVETMVCFLNEQGGRIIIGVDDDLTIWGIPFLAQKMLDEIKLYFKELRKKIEPQVTDKDVSTRFIPLTYNKNNPQPSDRKRFLICLVVRKGMSSTFYSYKNQTAIKARTDCSNEPLDLRSTIDYVQKKTKLGIYETEEENLMFNRKHYPEIEL